MAVKGKLGPAKQFGVRYGRTVKHLWGKIVAEQRRPHKCQYCSKMTVKRLASGIWYCRHCKAKFTGKAYEPTGAKPALESTEGGQEW